MPIKPTLTTVQEFKVATPGSYVVAGEAAKYLSRMQLVHYMEKADLAKRAKASARHRRRLVRKAHNYSDAIVSEIFAITCRYGCEVRLSGKVTRIIKPPKRPVVVKRLTKLCRLYTLTYGVRGTL